MFFERLDRYMKLKGLNDNKITVEAGISNGLIGKARKRGSLSQENISKLLHTYSDLDANWLLTGEGGMLKRANGEECAGNINYRELADAREKIIKLQEEKISRLEQEIACLKSMQR